MSIVPTVSKVHLILYHEPTVAASFHVALVESALVTLNAVTASIDTAVIGTLGCAAIEIVPRVDVLATTRPASRCFTISFAWHCSNRATCVNNQALFLLLAAKVDIHVEVLQICGVAI